MQEIAVGEVPVDLGAALGISETGRSVSVWQVQVRGQVAVYRTQAAAAPDPAAVAGARHASGSRHRVRVLTADLGRTWLWTAAGSGTAVVVVEPAAGQ